MALGLVGDHGVCVHPHVVLAPAVDLGPVLIHPLMEAGTTALVQVQAQNHAKSPHVLVGMHTMFCYLCKVLFFFNGHKFLIEHHKIKKNVQEQSKENKTFGN